MMSLFGRSISNYPGGKIRLLIDLIIYIISTIFILGCGIVRMPFGILVRIYNFFRVRHYRFITLSALILLLVIVFAVYYYIDIKPAGESNPPDTKIIVRRGETAISVAYHLKQKGIIDSPPILIRLITIIGSAKGVKAGQYDFSKAHSYYAITKLLLRGSNSPIKITFPEGLTYKRMGGIVRDKLGIDSLAFVKECEGRAIIDAFNIDADNLEGYLFPDTYYFYYGVNPKSIVESMVRHFFEVFDDSMRAVADSTGLTIKQVVILASLIEKETGLPSERRIISAVFHNRLKIGMPLQSDPTVIYALGETKEALLVKDLKVNSPYNTYIHYGLPPGPICNPGKASLEAALNPAQVPYLYFVASGDGGHLFATTNRQHNNNRIKVKRKAKLRRY